MKSTNLINDLIKGLQTSGYTDINVSKNEFNMFIIEMRKINEYKLYVFLRKVTKAGWKNLPEKRRVQVSSFNINELPPSGKKSTCMILGIQEIFDRNIFIAWNVYNYGYHATNRSCYVHTSNIYKVFTKGYLTTTDQSNKIWLSDEYNIDKLISSYIEYNYSSLGE